jgi:hypothetical protein
MQIRLSLSLALAVAMLVAVSASVSAQSAISGVVRDTSGAILPGVTVEASSPALIEKVRSGISDSDGRYAIVELRPGEYTVTFTLPGFRTLVRNGIELPANFTATVDGELPIGSLEESITVSGAAPTVDVQNTQRSAVLPREVLDAVPTSRTYAAEGALVVGVKVNETNVGGARSASQQRLTVHGSAQTDTTIEVDGISMNAWGTTQPNHNEALYQEAVVQTGSLGAEVGGGGVRMNLIPREGGNRYSGAVFAGYTGDAMQGSNLTPALEARGLRVGNEITLLYDSTFSIGGPIQQDKLWFFGSYRNIGNRMVIPNTFMPDGSPGEFDQIVQNVTGRLTWQASPRDKFSAYMDRAYKALDRELSPGVDPVTSAERRTPVLYYTAALKWTSTVSPRLLLQAGWGSGVQNRNSLYQPNAKKAYGTPEWFASASRVDLNRGTTRVGRSSPENITTDSFQTWIASATYTTGSHNAKVGIQWRYGTNGVSGELNGDLVQRYRDGVPDSVVVYNTPRYNRDGAFRIHADVGLYAQDTWKIGRAAISPGIRFYRLNGSIQPGTAPAGRFVPQRSYEGLPDVMDWWDVGPRLGVAYDLFGDGRTALKGAVSKYYQTLTNQYNRYNPLASQTDTRNWSDLNGDDIAQNIEIGATNNNRFGIGPLRRPDADLQRPSNIEYTLAIDRELFRNVSVSVAWIKRDSGEQERQDNILIGPEDYASFTVANPLTSEPLTIFNLNRAKQGLSDIVDTTQTDRSLRGQSYNGLEVSFNARPFSNMTVFGGFWTEKDVTITCDGDDPNTFLYCDQSALSVPYRPSFKVAGAYTFPYRIQVSSSFQSTAGNPLSVTWTPAANIFPGGRTQSVTVPLIAPGTKYLERINQLDVSFRKLISWRGVEWSAALDAFNIFNSNVVLNEIQAFGSSLGNPTEILQPRLFRISGQLRF